MEQKPQTNYARKRYILFWASYLVGYVFPFVYFFVKMGITKRRVSVVWVVVILLFVAVVKLSSAIPEWTSSWKPSFKKGLLKAIPKFILFIGLITLGLTIMYMIKQQVELAFVAYFETILVVFGGQCVGAVIEAFHLKYKELYLLQEGYVLGVVNKR